MEMNIEKINNLLNYWYKYSEIPFGCMKQKHKCIVKYDENIENNRFYCESCHEWKDEVRDYDIKSLKAFYITGENS